MPHLSPAPLLGLFTCPGGRRACRACADRQAAGRARGGRRGGPHTSSPPAFTPLISDHTSLASSHTCQRALSLRCYHLVGSFPPGSEWMAAGDPHRSSPIATEPLGPIFHSNSRPSPHPPASSCTWRAPGAGDVCMKPVAACPLCSRPWGKCPCVAGPQWQPGGVRWHHLHGNWA